MLGDPPTPGAALRHIRHAMVLDDEVHADNPRGLVKALNGHPGVGAAVYEQDLDSYGAPSPTSRAASFTRVGTSRSGGAKKAG
jgi:hypothetical protein